MRFLLVTERITDLVWPPNPIRRCVYCKEEHPVDEFGVEFPWWIRILTVTLTPEYAWVGLDIDWESALVQMSIGMRTLDDWVYAPGKIEANWTGFSACSDIVKVEPIRDCPRFPPDKIFEFVDSIVKKTKYHPMRFRR